MKKVLWLVVCLMTMAISANSQVSTNAQKNEENKIQRKYVLSLLQELEHIQNLTDDWTEFEKPYQISAKYTAIPLMEELQPFTEKGIVREHFSQHIKGFSFLTTDLRVIIDNYIFSDSIKVSIFCPYCYREFFDLGGNYYSKLVKKRRENIEFKQFIEDLQELNRKAKKLEKEAIKREEKERKEKFNSYMNNDKIINSKKKKDRKDDVYR